MTDAHVSTRIGGTTQLVLAYVAVAISGLFLPGLSVIVSAALVVTVLRDRSRTVRVLLLASGLLLLLLQLGLLADTTSAWVGPIGETRH